jgi:hypothetical protein
VYRYGRRWNESSRSLFEAQQKGVAVDAEVMKRAEAYTVDAINVNVTAAPLAAASAASVGAIVARTGVGGGVATSIITRSGTFESAGVGLYQSAQALELLSRTEAD